jgi:hypothetical protein
MTTTLPHRNATEATNRPAGTVECLCPFCGSFNGDVGRPCRHCGTEDTTAARAAARKRVGPWFVHQSKNLAAPGMSLPSLLTMIRQGSVTHRSVIRGPATGQLWRLAGKVRGISREFGSCYGCGGDLYAADPTCPHCQRPQSLPADIDAEPEVVAPRTDRPLPRQDLLTPRDVAKAFSLGFAPPAGVVHNAPAGGASVTLDDLLPRTGAAGGRSRPTALATCTVAVAVACIGWLLIHGLGGRQPAPAMASESTPTAQASVRFDSIRTVTAAPPPPTLDEPTVRPAMMVRADTTPTVIPDDEPSTVTTASSELAPADAAGTADDPKQLMAAGLSAEARGDYAGAVKLYERIESLSSDEWPAGLKDRLSLARSAAHGD